MVRGGAEGGGDLRGLLALALLAGCAGAPPSPAPPVAGPPAGAPATVSAPELERELLGLLNEHRAGRGLAPLAPHPALADLAREHSRAMAGGGRPFGHDGFEERSAAAAAAYPLRAFAENVAYHSDAPRLAGRIASGWIASPPHRANLEGAFDATGIGAARSPAGVWYLTQLFAARP